jgi:hypothetical protein
MSNGFLDRIREDVISIDIGDVFKDGSRELEHQTIFQLAISVRLAYFPTGLTSKEQLL